MLYLLVAALAAKPNIKNPEITEADIETEVTSAVGQVMIDARLPSEIRIDGKVMGQLFVKGRLTVDIPVGQHEVVVITNGLTRAITVDIGLIGRTVVLVGRTGLTSTHQVPDDVDEGEATVELRVAGSQPMLVAVDDQRWRLDPRSTKTVKIPVGEHKMSVHSGDGYTLFARGRIELTRSDIAIVQLSEGRMPEVSGVGASFHPGR